MRDRPFALLVSPVRFASFARATRTTPSIPARAAAFAAALVVASTLTACSDGPNETSEPAHDAETADADASDARDASDERPRDPQDDPADFEACVHEVSEMDLDEVLHSTDATGTAVWIVRARRDETFLTWTLRETEDGSAPTEGIFGEEQRTPSEARSAPLVQTECHDHGDHFHCGPSFVATRGTWRVIELDRRIGGSFHATLSARFEQARISKGKATLTSDGTSVCLRELALSGTLMAPSSAP